MPVIQPGAIILEESVTNLIRSSAAGESTIAYILNAESKKHRAIVNMPDASASDLMAANGSVKKMVNIVIQLEGALKSKLDLFQI